MRKQGCPIRDASGIAGITADVHIKRVNELAVGEAGIHLVEIGALRNDKLLPEYRRIVQRDSKTVSVGNCYATRVRLCGIDTDPIGIAWEFRGTVIEQPHKAQESLVCTDVGALAITSVADVIKPCAVPELSV